MNEYGILDVGGIRSNDYSIYILDVNDADMPKRDYTAYSVPGKSRDIHFDNGRYFNVTRTYKCFVKDDRTGKTEDIINAFVSRLMRLKGYQKIQDTLHLDYYKIGEFIGEVVPTWAKTKNAARFDLSFDCDARKYLKTGEVEINLGTGTKTIFNPGTEDAHPIFTITGNGYIEIASRRITISGNTTTMIIDTDLGDAYSQEGHSNLNSLILINGAGEIPYMVPGSNSVKVSSLSSCTMIPRWNST